MRSRVETAFLIIAVEGFLLLVAVVDDTFATVELAGLLLPVVVGYVAHLLWSRLLLRRGISYRAAVGTEFGIFTIEEHIFTQTALKATVVERYLHRGF